MNTIKLEMKPGCRLNDIEYMYEFIKSIDIRLVNSTQIEYTFITLTKRKLYDIY